MIDHLHLAPEHWHLMKVHVDACAPNEACGLLIGSGAEVLEVRAMMNAAQSATRFRMEPVEQLLAFQEIDDRGLELVGVFHSHPAEGGCDAADGPSETDVREAAYPVVQIIWHRCHSQWQARAFWIEPPEISRVALFVRGRQ